MLSSKEILVLRHTILEYQPRFEQAPGTNCIPKGLKLYDTYKGGALIWIGELSKIDLKGIAISHLYFFPAYFSDIDIALNLGDNGFPQYPPLNRREALEIGVPKDPSNMREKFFFSMPRL